MKYNEQYDFDGTTVAKTVAWYCECYFLQHD